MRKIKDVLERIEIYENNIKKFQDTINKNFKEIEYYENLMKNIKFDFRNLETFHRIIGGLYSEMNNCENSINFDSEFLKYHYEELEKAVTDEEYDEIQNQLNLENEMNLNENLKEMMKLFENSEIYGKNEISIKKFENCPKAGILYIKYLDDNSYQFKTYKKNINVKRKNTIIKYIQEFLQNPYL